MVAEKNISESRLVNGATRLQPIAMLVGQASGAAAALAALQGIQPRSLAPGAVQRVLVDAGSRLTNLDYPDVPKMVRFWTDIQLVSVHGLMSAAQGSAFLPYAALTPQAFQQILDGLSPGLRLPEMSAVSREDFQKYLRKATGIDPEVDLAKKASVSRTEAAGVLARMLVRQDLGHAMQFWPAAAPSSKPKHD